MDHLHERWFDGFDVLVKIVSGYLHTLALTNKGEIYAWGNNDCGQVGVKNNFKSCNPIVVIHE